MNKEFHKSIQPEIEKLFASVLSDKEKQLADALTRSLLLGKEKRQTAVEQLQKLVGTIPKRPLYYLSLEIRNLPEQTRNVVRYAGDYVDQLIKYASFEKGKRWFPGRALSTSLGGNLKNLKDILPLDLHDTLTQFNNKIYTPAKHEWDVQDRPHLFSAAEAVYTCLFAKVVALRIIEVSAEARQYAVNKKFNYHYDTSQR